jgi:hypothetical protein
MDVRDLNVDAALLQAETTQSATPNEQQRLDLGAEWHIAFLIEHHPMRIIGLQALNLPASERQPSKKSDIVSESRFRLRLKAREWRRDPSADRRTWRVIIRDLLASPFRRRDDDRG